MSRSPGGSAQTVHMSGPGGPQVPDCPAGTAGTPAGDLFAEERGLGYGLPIAMASTGGVLVLRGRKVLVSAG